MLDGIKVVELATFIAGPAAACMLADWGADVIKVEPLAGDPMRRAFDDFDTGEDHGNPSFELDNRGKRSLALDIRSGEGQAVMRQLVGAADVFITNVRPGGLARSGLDWDALKAVNARLVYATVTGYGLAGAERDRPGFDVTAFWSRAGVARMTVPKGADIFPPRAAFGDHITALSLVSGILAALVERGRTGRGRLVETSLLRTGTYTVSSDLAVQLRFGRLVSNRPRHQVLNPLSNFFRAGDERWLCLTSRLGKAGEWQAILRVVGLEALADDPRFKDARARRANAAALVAILDEAFAKAPLAHWAGRLDAEDLAWAPVQSAAEVVDDAQVKAAGAFLDIPRADGKGTRRTVAAPVRFHGPDGAPATGDVARGPAPALGQHTDEILGELGYPASERAALREAKAVA